jgi:hypothetical protein
MKETNQRQRRSSEKDRVRKLSNNCREKDRKDKSNKENLQNLKTLANQRKLSTFNFQETKLK